jgi:transcriptional regulator with XRE-family HTH domain
MDIGTRIRTARKDKGISQAVIARRIGISVAAVSNWETGKNDLSGDSLIAVAAILGVSPAWLQTGRGEQSPGTQIQEYQSPEDELSHQERAMVELFRVLTDDQKSEIVRSLEAQKQQNKMIWEQLSKVMGKK